MVGSSKRFLWSLSVHPLQTDICTYTHTHTRAVSRRVDDVRETFSRFGSSLNDVCYACSESARMLQNISGTPFETQRTLRKAVDRFLLLRWMTPETFWIPTHALRSSRHVFWNAPNIGWRLWHAFKICTIVARSSWHVFWITPGARWQCLAHVFWIRRRQDTYF